MAINIPCGGSDELMNQIIAVLEDYQEDHPKARIDTYRQNSVSVRIRILDPGFSKLGAAQRNDLAWQFLSRLPDEVQSEVSVLVLLTPVEAKKSFANFEFE